MTCKTLSVAPAILSRPSEDGEYEDYYLPVMAACAGVGKALFDDWVDWVLRGHHGEKPENIKPFKWRGLGKIWWTH